MVNVYTAYGSRCIEIGNCSINKNDDDEPLLNNLNVKHALTPNYIIRYAK